MRMYGTNDDQIRLRTRIQIQYHRYFPNQNDQSRQTLRIQSQTENLFRYHHRSQNGQYPRTHQNLQTRNRYDDAYGDGTCGEKNASFSWRKWSRRG